MNIELNIDKYYRLIKLEFIKILLLDIGAMLFMIFMLKINSTKDFLFLFGFTFLLILITIWSFGNSLINSWTQN